MLPLGSSADVKWRNAPGNTPTMRYTAGGVAPAGALSALAGGGIQSAGAPGAAIGLDPTGTLYADLSTATAATINAIRIAFQVQKLLERDARVVLGIRKLSVLILALYHLIHVFSVLNIWGF